MMCDRLCSLLIKQGVNEGIVRPAKTDLAAANLFLDQARVRVLGETTVAAALCEIALYLDGSTSEVVHVVTRAVGRLIELVGATTLDSEDVNDIERALDEDSPFEEIRKKFERAKIPA